MKKTLAAVLTLIITLSLSVFAQVKPDVIYGEDNRLDLYQTQDSRMLSLADATVALFYAKSVALEGDKTRLFTSPYGASNGLCAEETFYDQYAGAFCSGFLVRPDLIMTAGHCVMTQQGCETIKFVFGFSIKNASAKNPNKVASSEVYGCKKLLGREQVNGGVDWALVRLDRAVTDHKPLALNRSGSIGDGAPLFVIGHPAGLPTKIAAGAKVRNASPNGYFVANLDTYGGNSGSAVFNAQTGLVEGILVRGENDYVWKTGSNCRVSQVCAADGCRGEDVTKISAVIPQFPLGAPANGKPRVSPLGKSLATAIEKLAASSRLEFDRR